jgi:hypothetical protein
MRVAMYDGSNPEQIVSRKIVILQIDGIHDHAHFYENFLGIITRRGVVMAERMKQSIYYLKQLFIFSSQRKHLPIFWAVLVIKTKEIKSLPQALPMSMCLGIKISSKPRGPNSAAPSSDCA